jgi:hypothetical protein
MLVERIAWDTRDRPVEYAKDIYRGDRSRFVAELRLERSELGHVEDVHRSADGRR